MQAEEPGIRYAEQSWEKMVANSSNQGEEVGKPEVLFLTGVNTLENSKRWPGTIH